MESEKKMDEQPGAVSPPAYGAYYDQPAGGPDGGPVATGGGYPVYPPAQPGQGGYPPPTPGGYPPQGQSEFGSIFADLVMLFLFHIF